MASLFETAFQNRVIPAAMRVFGVLVTLSRGVVSTDEFTARRNDKQYTAIGADYGIEVSVMMRDFIFPVVSLVIEEQTIEPRTGDRITEGAEVFEISPPDNNTPSIALIEGGYEWLVHTKRIE